MDAHSLAHQSHRSDDTRREHRQLPVGSVQVGGGRTTALMRPVLVSRQSLRVVLGLFWLLDGALQLQSFMFTKGFAKGILAPAAAGQPFFVAGPVQWNAQVIGAHPEVLNAAFASVQLILGLALLLRRTERVAIVGSIVWAAGVWYLGEGLGGLAGGHTTALVGAPGAALLYMVLSLAAWPGRNCARSGQGGQRPPHWVLAAWVFLWVGFAALRMLPSNVEARTIQSQLNMNASMVPSWLATIDRVVASAVHSLGVGAVAITVAVELAVGLLVIRRGVFRTVALWAGIGVAGLYWGVGQNFGQLFGGQATDPSTGPLLILLGLAALGARQSMTEPEALAGGIVDTTGKIGQDRLAA